MAGSVDEGTAVDVVHADLSKAFKHYLLLHPCRQTNEVRARYKDYG